MKNDWLAAALKLPEIRWLMLIPAFGVSIVAVMWICVLSQLDTERKLVLDAALRDTESYVKAFAEHTQRILGEADRTALLLKYQFEKDGAIDLPRMVARLSAALTARPSRSS